MAAQIRSVDFLPEIFQTPVNTQFLNATLDQLIQEPQYKQTQGFIGQRVGPGVNANDSYVIEPTKIRNNYQLEPGVISLNPVTGKIDDAITYPGILDALSTQGGIVNQQDRLFESEYYSWDPFVDFDKYSNYSQYYWLPNGPDLVTVAPTSVPTEQTFTVTRTNGAYTFSGYEGTNPTLTLVREGNYNFVVAQNTANAVDYRVINNGTSSWAIDQTANPTLTLVRGNTYTWNLVQTGPYKFYIKTEASFGTANLFSEGVTNNGAYSGLVTFTVPQDAPDVLYYCNDVLYNLRGQLNIIDATSGSGPQFWIQTQPGIDGRLPWSPNISDRDVFGVSNNGTDLGTVTFNVPTLTAQSFYQTLPYINYPSTGTGTVDLICSTFTYSQLDGVLVDTFLSENPTGIDGITNLNSRTLVFTDDTDPTVLASLWQIQYVSGVIQLNSILTITNNTQFSITYGTEYVNTQWYKNSFGSYEQIPLLTASLPAVYYQDSEDPTIFGQIKFITENVNSTTSPLAVIGINATGSSVTLNFTTQLTAPYSIGSSIIVSQVNPAGYNGTYFVTSCTTSSVTFNSTETAAYIGGGTINSINVNAYINVDTEIVGQKNYVSPNGVTFTNGLKVVFQGNVYPTSYIGNSYYVQGVGSSIFLVPTSSLGILNVNTDILGQQSYTSSNGIKFTNNLKIKFNGTVYPDSYSNNIYYVEGVGRPGGIYLSQIIIVAPSTTTPSTTINVNTQILGQSEYTTPAGVVFTNGLKVTFQGDVTPSSYVGNTYYVQGVGSSITLLDATNHSDSLYSTEIIIQPVEPDYLTINMASPDLNPWSRSNRWFHVDVIDAAAAYNDIQPSYTNAQRANRPILEFRAGTKLFNFGTQGITPVNVIDTTQTDALLNVAGQLGYGIDGYTLVQDSLVIFAADNNLEVRNQIYQVNFIVVDPEVSLVPIIDLVPISTNPVLVNQVTVCTSGNTQTGKSFYYTGSEWLSTQQKTAVNQAPLFDVYNSSGVSFSDPTQYPSSNFAGCKLLSYAENADNPIDEVLGIPLAFFSINNIGDILFDNNLYTDSFIYTPAGGTGSTIDVSSGFVRQYSDRVTFTREIGWQTATIPSLARQQFQFSYAGTPLQFDIAIETNLDVPPAQVFINSLYQEPSTYTLSVNTTTNTSTITLNGSGYVTGDVIEVLVYSQQVSDQGFYEIPINLENNPFNENSSQFSLGTVRNHYNTICENLTALQGPINGRNNTRDLGNIIPYGQLILQQSSPLTLAGYFLRSANYNIFAALEYNNREYTKYKNKLLTAVTQLNLNGTETVSQILDLAIRNITTSLTSSDPFYWSDMLPAGTNYTTNTITVNPITTNVFNTNEMYNFTSSNYLGLLVYVNKVLLLRGSQYTVSTDALKLTIHVPLSVGDVVTIDEYPVTYPNWCPNTPSKMGLYPKYTPSIFVDDTYSEPTVVIQGHDGSITIAFGDIRDQVLLEFEKRIYNNIKLDDNPIPLATDEVDPDFYPDQTTGLLPGFFRDTPYTYQEINQIMSEDFLTWVGQNKIDYTTQNYVANNPFTWNYSQAADRVDQQPFLQGNWRGIYRYFYDTETPNSTPWEMVGFSEEPDWWVLRYGPAPYTSGNTVLWDDLEAGIVGNPAGPYILPEYVRPGLRKIIPAGTSGELLPPNLSVMGRNNPYGFQQSWVAGDGGPVQASWWNSSSYPFAIMRMLALTKPAQFFSLYADRDLYRYNTELGQYLLNDRYRLDATGVQVYGNGVSKASYINWIVDYNQQFGVNSTTDLTIDLANLDVRLCYRMASFSDPVYVQLFTERAGPNSTNNSLLVPPSSYDLLFYKNQPFNQITYSSVIVQVEQLGSGGIGYSVQGYSSAQPYFEILQSNPVGLYSTLTAGNLSVQVPSQYTNNIKQIPYGYVFTTPASVCDFLLSYGAWLSSQGIVFDNIFNGHTLNWSQMCQEFLNFAAQGWEPNTIINLNPCATKITASQPISIVDTVASITPENMLLDQNAEVLDVRNLVVYRDGNLFSITTTNSQTINYLTLKFTNYEDMIVLNNTSQFNDLIYDPATAARQSRLSLIASTTTQWDGQLNAQGFILNLNNVEQWKPYTKYTKGEIVLYKNTYWQALTISEPQETFNYVEWVKSNYQLIDNGLLPNLANKADQLVTTYNVYQANLTSDNDLFAFGLIGFRPRQYMTDLNLNDVTQVQLYQQFIGTKGSLQAAEIFNTAQLNRNESGAYNVYENWGILSGTYGAQANKSNFDIQLNQALLPYNPSTIQIINPGETSQANQQIYLSNLWKESYNITSTDILPTIYEGSNTPTALPSAGYVCLDDIDVTVFSLEDPSSIDANINIIGIGTYIWIAKINPYDWGVYRTAAVGATMTQLSDNLNGTSVAQFNNTHNLSIGDLIIIKYFNNAINGVYRVLTIPTPTTVTIAYSFTKTNVTTVSGTGLVLHLQSARVTQASDISKLPYVNSLVPGAIAWVDDDGDGHWEAVQKQSPFVTSSTLVGPTANNQFAYSIAQAQNNLFALVGSPGGGNGAGRVAGYYKDILSDYQFSTDIRLDALETSNFGNMLAFGASNWAVAGANTSMSGTGYAAVIYRVSGTDTAAISQLLVPPDQNFSAIEFGTAGVISTDENWMYIGAPGANCVYAYQKVQIEDQSIQYITANDILSYRYNNALQIDYAHPAQLKVYLGGSTEFTKDTLLTYGIDYTIDASSITFLNNTPPNNGQYLTIRRNELQQLDEKIYYHRYQNSVVGVGTGALFTVQDTRGVYYPTLEFGGQNYSIGDVLTINGTQLGGTNPTNNLTITVTGVNILGTIVGFSYVGTGIINANNFVLNQYLYNATTINNFVVSVNKVIQRPYLDYTFDSQTTALTFITIPPEGAEIYVSTPTYWQYVEKITSAQSLLGDRFGASIATSTDGRQITVGAPNSNISAGKAYVFDRSVLRFIVSNPSQTTYTVAGSITAPATVSVNGVYLLTTSQSTNGQYTVNGNNVVFSNITFNYGDIIEIGTNQITQIQQLYSSTPNENAQYGFAIDSCPLNCSLYLGAPFDSTRLDLAGSVDHQVNQSRVYGITTSTIANPTLTAGGTLRINDTQVTVPSGANNTIEGFAAAINAANIPNVLASTTSNLEFLGDGSTKIFYIGDLYSSASSYTTVVYIDNIKQTAGTDYTYDNATQNIYFLYAPLAGRKITIISGRLTISVKNINGGIPYNYITVLPGTVSSVFNQLGFNTFVLTQQILSPAPVFNGQFGASLSIDTSAVNLIVGSPNGNVYEPTTFDAGQTYFDEHSTTFYNPIINGGVAYTYDYFPSSNKSINNPGQFAFGQQIYINTKNVSIKSGDRFGTSVSYVTGKLMVGATGGTVNNTTSAGYAAVFQNPDNTPSWKPIRTQQPVVDVYGINGVFSYNGEQSAGVNTTITGQYQTYFDFFDPLQGKILGIARSNIDYIGAVDPAQYNQGSVHNNGQTWSKEHIGQMWWDTDTVRFIDPNQDDIVYASRRWGQTFPGSKVDIYQWVESANPPSNYTGTGTPLSTTSYVISSQLGQNNIFTTLYYFWVKGITTVATGSGKTLSPTAVSSYILDPRSSGLPYIAGLNASTIAIYNAQNLLNASNTILSIGFDREITDAVIHQEYQIITDGIDSSFLNTNLYRKFLDSMCGLDTVGNPVPDPLLSPGMKYGVQFRPRQSMFDDRFTALENYLGRANTVLAQYPISETRSFNLLNSSEPIPTSDVTVTAGNFVIGTTYTILTVGTTNFTTIGASSNTAGVSFVATGSGSGTGSATTIVWNTKVANLEILGYQNLASIPVGYKYLVLSDSSQNGRWTIYEITAPQTLDLHQVQSYDTPEYWYYVNWYLPGYNSSIAPVAAVQNYGQLSTLSLETAPVGSSVRVVSNGAGKFEIYKRSGPDPYIGWTRVGLEDGTIAFKEDLWNYTVGNFGFDAQVFDSQYFDETPQVETRYILRALNEEIYVEDLEYERNSSLILIFNYVYSQFIDPSWLIKTSYVDVNHKIRSLLPYQSYLSGDQNFVLKYFQEVKPYHVQVRQFNLIYTGEDDFLGDITDYDLPAYWDSTLSDPQFVSPILTPYTEAITTSHSSASNTAPNAQIWQYPSLYSQWYQNYLLSVDAVTIPIGGAGYTSTPVVTVTGTCVEQASMTAIINTSGQVIGITINNPGSGYTTDAVITISGGGLPEEPTLWSAGLTVVSNESIITSENTIYKVTTAGTLGNAEPITRIINAGNFIIGSTYTIQFVGTTDFTAIGADSNQSGIVFIATGTGSGTGTAITNTVTVTNGTVILQFVGQIARAVSIMGNPSVRSLNLTLKYDRYEYQSDIVDWTPTEFIIIDLTNVVASNGIATATFEYEQTSIPFSDGNSISINGVSVSALNGTYSVSSCSTINLTYPTTYTGAGYNGQLNGTVLVKYINGTQVRHNNVVYAANGTDGYVQNSVFDPAEWTIVNPGILSGVNRTQGYYVSTVNNPGLNLPLLIDGIDYPGVQVSAVTFNQDTGFDRGNFDINVYDNISLDANGQPTYDLGILNTIFRSFYGTLETGPIPTGTAVSDINIDGGKYVDVYESHAPEELVPGIEFDTLDFRVYTTPGADWQGLGHGFPQVTLQVIYDNSNPTISFAGLQPYPVAIEITDTTQGYDLSQGYDYTIDWVNQTITISNSSLLVADGDRLAIYVYELGGGNQLYKNVYNGAEVGNSLVIPVQYELIQEIAVFVNGTTTTAFTFIDNASVTFGTTLINFDNTYNSTDFISLVAIGPTTINDVTTNYSWSVPTTQYLMAVTGQYDDYELDPTINLEYTNPLVAMVTIGGVTAIGSAGVPYVGDGNTNGYAFPERTGIDYTTISDSNVKVYVDGILQINPTDYTLGVYTGFSGDSLGDNYSIAPYDLDINTKFVLFDTPPAAGTEIYIAVDELAQYTIDPVARTLSFIPGTGIVPDNGQVISVTTFNDTREQRLSTQIFVGPVTITEGIVIEEGFDTTLYSSAVQNDDPGSYSYQEGITISENDFVLYQSYTDAARAWVFLKHVDSNCRVLSPYIDYTIEGNILTLNSGVIGTGDILMVINVTSSVVPEAMEFRIFQDMRGMQATYRMTSATTTTVAQAVSATDDIIHVVNASALSIPDFAANVWGVVTIDGERIMYRDIDLTDNTISSLLRGTAGTGADSHAVGAYVYDMGRGNLLPAQYQDYIESESFLGDGSTKVFTSTLVVNNANEWVASTPYDSTLYSTDGINGEYDPGAASNSRAVEVYLGGTLQTSGYTLSNLDPVVVIFVTAPDAGTEVSIFVRKGTSWYNPGVDTASDGVPLQITNNPMALFLRGGI